jgi:hypothetical protein
VDQLPKHAFIRAETVGCVETAQSAAAQRATAFGIQREGIDKRRMALDAVEFRVERLRLGEAAFAYRDTADGVQGTAANAAIIGKNQGKKGTGGCSDC